MNRIRGSKKSATLPHGKAQIMKPCSTPVLSLPVLHAQLFVVHGLHPSRSNAKQNSVQKDSGKNKSCTNNNVSKKKKKKKKCSTNVVLKSFNAKKG